jgi:hypothetical protein
MILTSIPHDLNIAGVDRIAGPAFGPPTWGAVQRKIARAADAKEKAKNHRSGAETAVTLLFAAADEALLATARQAMRMALAWESIVADQRLQLMQLTVMAAPEVCR